MGDEKIDHKWARATASGHAHVEGGELDMLSRAYLDLAARNERLVRENERLREALAPFAYARVATGWDSFGDDTGLPFGEGLTLGQFRRARAAYEEGRR